MSGKSHTMLRSCVSCLRCSSTCSCVAVPLGTLIGAAVVLLMTPSGACPMAAASASLPRSFKTEATMSSVVFTSSFRKVREVNANFKSGTRPLAS
eukprot:6460224-Amphidinium_carterae.1